MKTSPRQLLELFVRDGDGDEVVLRTFNNKDENIRLYEDLHKRGLVEAYTDDDCVETDYGLSERGRRYILGKIKFPRRIS